MAASPVNPNLLFIMTDQQRFDALSGHGGWIQTPHLDRLASEGVDLRNHFAQAPVCVPSRCSLFSGRYGHAHGVLENNGRLGPREVHLFKVLKQQGYHLTYAGKNHLLPETEMVNNFDRYTPMDGNPGDDPRRAAYVALEEKSLHTLFTVNSWGSGAFHDCPDDVTTSGLIAAATKQDLRRAPVDRPWCVTTSFSDPHVPHLAPRRFAARYAEVSIPLPEWDETEHAAQHPRVAVKREAQRNAEASPSDQRRYLEIYGAMCTYVDELIGGILETLRTRPDADRTLIVFVSDHGDFCWHHGLCKKDLLLYDDLLHVPAIFHWPPQLSPGVVADTLSEHVDVLPTVLDLLGIQIPDACQGRSMADLLRGRTSRHRDEVHAEVCYPSMRSGYRSAREFRSVWDHDQATNGPLAGTAPFNVPGDHTRCVRTRRWKYIWYGDGFEELYDLQSDPAEARNLADQSTAIEVLTAMRLLLQDWSAPNLAATLTEVSDSYDRWRS